MGGKMPWHSRGCNLRQRDFETGEMPWHSRGCNLRQRGFETRKMPWHSRGCNLRLRGFETGKMPSHSHGSSLQIRGFKITVGTAVNYHSAQIELDMSFISYAVKNRESSDYSIAFML